MGIELARAFVTIRADAAQLSSDLSGVKGQIDSSMKEIAAGAAALLVPLARLGQGVLSSGIKGAEDYEKTKVEMETLIGDAEETKDTLDSLTKFAAETPFEMPQLLDVSRQLLTFGERGSQMMGTLKMLGDASMGDAQKFGMLGLVFNQVRGVGKLLTQDFRQLSTRGILSLSDIAKYFKVSESAASSMLSSGKISFNDFRNILEGLTKEGGRFSDGMLKQSQTLYGLKSTFNDSVNIIKRFIAEPLVPYLKDFYSVLIEATNGLGGLIQAGGEATSFAFVGATAFAVLGAAITGATFAAKLFGITMKRALIGTGVGIAFVAIGAAVGFLVSKFELLGQLKGLLPTIKDKLAGMGNTLENLKQTAMRLRDALFAIGKALWSAIYPIIQRIYESAQGLFGSIFKGFSIEKFSEQLVDAAEWIQATAENIRDVWRDLWGNFPLVVKFAWSYMQDIVRNGFLLMVQTFGVNVGKMIDKFYAMVAEMKIAWLQVKWLITGRGDLPMSAVIGQRQNAEYFAGMAKGKLGIGPDGEFKGKIGDMGEDTKKLADEIGKAFGKTFDKIRDRKRQLEIARKGGMTPIEEEKKKKKEREPDALGGEQRGVGAGIYEIAAFGKKFQENLLDKKNYGAETVDLLAKGNGLQQGVLDEMKKPKQQGLGAGD